MKIKSKNSIILLIILFGFKIYSQQVTNGFSMPESVVSNGSRFFVSNQGQDFMNKDGDGFISEVSADGRLIDLKFLPKDGVLNAPKGMAIAKNILYVADLDRIVGFDLKNGKTVFELKIDGAQLLNDICLMNEDFIGVTETVSGTIYNIGLKQKSVEIVGHIPTVNGIAYNKVTEQLVVCTNGVNYGEGAIYLYSKSENNFYRLPNITNGFYDGIEWVDDSHLLISDWITFPTNGKGKLWVYDLDAKTSKFYFVEESVADIYFDHVTSKVYMPQMLHNRLLVSPLSQIENEKKSNTLYNYGVIDGFIGGLYEGSLPIKSLYLNGDFGLGAPDMLDGELTMLDGQAYQTNSTGETKKLPNDHKTSFASVTFFAPENILVQDGQQDKAATLDYIVSRLSNKNGMYAIQISGSFKYIKTRAFPPVDKKPHPKLSDILDRQEFFEYRDIDGTLVGFLLPDYLNGINASGFHFHFLSEDRKSGGHILEFIGQNLKIEIDELQDFKLDVPFDANFKNYNFSKKDNEALEKVEKGKE